VGHLKSVGQNRGQTLISVCQIPVGLIFQREIGV